MLLFQTLRRAAYVHVGLTRAVSTSSTMTSPQNFKLDRTLFNQTLYDRVREVWFQDLAPGATAATKPALQRWYGAFPPEQKANFDDDCRSSFEPALLSLHPDRLALPPFTTHDADIAQASTLSAPFLAEISTAQPSDPQRAADTLLALLILLDQIPRNIYREPASLPLVYTHYDRLAFALLYAARHMTPSSLAHESFVGNQARMHWLAMPLLHAEHRASHEVMREMFAKCRCEAEATKDADALAMLDVALPSLDDHWRPLQRFGRYPHRNEALGRANTEEEEEFLETAETFGVQQSKGKKDGGREAGKRRDEL